MENLSGLEEQRKDCTNEPEPRISRYELKKKRIDELLDSCREQVLHQIIGPFGLSPALFSDINGGNVTTNHNFTSGICATDADKAKYEEYQRNLSGPIDRKPYDQDLPEKRKDLFQKPEPIISAYTGLELPRDGQTHLDHVTSVKKIETDPSMILNMSKEQRIQLANENLVPCEKSINQSMQDKDKSDWAESNNCKDPSKTNAEYYKVDLTKLRLVKFKADVQFETRNMQAIIVKQGGELIHSGIDQAKKNAVRQAMGLLIFEFVNGSFIEIRRIISKKSTQKSIIDQLIEGFKNVASRIEKKFGEIFNQLVSGGVQGFLSNLLTYLINLFVTTSAKVVSIIRESTKELWKAIKLVWNPPAGMPKIEVAREASKIIAGIISLSLGLLFEKSVQGFIMTIPLLIPIADILSPAITAILTGIMSSLVIFGLDTFFDWLSSDGTELIEAQIEKLYSNVDLIEKSAQNLDIQFRISHSYQLCADGYNAIEQDMHCIRSSMENSIFINNRIIDANEKFIESCVREKAAEKIFSQKLHDLGIED